tara:strand:+ start:310 stop:417 length:108 start_codon:yes stop_codon:yes gene_type:complete
MISSISKDKMPPVSRIIDKRNKIAFIRKILAKSMT